MVIGKRRCLKRKFSVKKVSIVTIVCLLGIYIVSVIHRAPKSRTVWDVVGFKNVTDGQCGMNCPYGQVSFYVKTGLENKEGPTVCFKNEVLFSEAKNNVHRGLNIAIIDDQTLKVVNKKVYDTYIDDSEFLHDMKEVVKERHIIIAASYDEISESLKEQGRRWLKVFGAEYIDQVSFRDAFLLIGQKGLKQGYAIEIIERRGSELYSRPIEKLGCFSVPMGPVLHVADAISQIAQGTKVITGDTVVNCGMKTACKDNEFSARVFTGTDSTKFPEVCVNDKMVMTKTLNNAGRGINVVTIDPNSKQPKETIRFDTYERESVDLESFLENLAHGDIVIAVVFDEGSRKLAFHSRELFNQLGSSMIQNLKFRDVWYFIGQKGIDGFTSMEKISFAGMDAEWPKPLETSVCVPTKIVGSPVIPDPPAYRNDAKRSFCQKYDGYAEFCDPANVDDRFIKPVGLNDDVLKKNPVYASPIVIIPGLNQNAFVKTLETTVMQPGVKMPNIMVSFDEKFPEQGELAGLYGLKNVSVSSSRTYPDHVRKSMAEAAKLYPNARYMVVLEEELLLAPDFLYFLAQTAQTLDKDPTLLGISAFNYNGYDGISGNKSMVYRLNEFPGIAFMIKMSLYKERMKDNFSNCCLQRAWYGWTLDNKNKTEGGDILVPDVSRAFRLPYEGAGPSEEFLTALFNRPRVTSVDRQVKVFGQDMLTSMRYEQWTADQLTTAKSLPTEEVKECVKSGGRKPLKIIKYGGIFSIYYKQADSEDYKGLVKLCSCFGCFALEGQKPKNLYHGVVRFTFMGNSVFLVGSTSTFAKYKSSTAEFQAF